VKVFSHGAETAARGSGRNYGFKICGPDLGEVMTLVNNGDAKAAEYTALFKTTTVEPVDVDMDVRGAPLEHFEVVFSADRAGRPLVRKLQQIYA